MANRHLSRSIVLQTLFEWDVNNDRGTPSASGSIDEVLDRNIGEFAPGTKDQPFMRRLMRGVLEKQKDLDMIIAKAAPEWPITKISPVDRNILRIGLYELLFSDRKEVPAKVAINEAIELGKNFGGEASGRFVNGVLGAVYKEIGEPGKNETSGPKKKTMKRGPEVPFEKMPIERKAGAVVYAKHEGDIYIALVHDVFGHWTLAKGSVEEGESLEDAVVREIQEEIGVTAEVQSKLGVNEYVASTPDRGKVRKNVSYFLLESPYEELTLEKKGGLDDARWFKLNQILDLNFYHDILPVITTAINALVKK